MWPAAPRFRSRRCRARSTGSKMSASRRATRVADAVRELGYVPHAGARSLSLARIERDRRRPARSPRRVLFGDRARDGPRGEPPRLSAAAVQHARPQASRRRLRCSAMRGRVDGLIVMAPHLVRGRACRGAPGRTSGGPDQHPRRGGRPARASISTMPQGAAAVADHLVALGRTRLVHIAGPAGNIDAQERAAAFRAACAAHARATARSSRAISSEESGSAAIVALLDSGREFDAVFAANDNDGDRRAAGVADARASASPRTSRWPASTTFRWRSHLGLTTVRVRIAELGERALERLIAILGGARTAAATNCTRPNWWCARPRRREAASDRLDRRKLLDGIVAACWRPAASRRALALRGPARAHAARHSMTRSSGARFACSGTR